MRQEQLCHLVCPLCASQLELDEVKEQHAGSIKEGTLKCAACRKTYDITGHIPRFVALENYAAGFGFEWNKHSRTQYDSYAGTNLSETRFFEETKWPRDLQGQTVLEVGSGSGRFTEQAASTGATVVSLDYSTAVDANYRSNGEKSNVLIVQGDIYSMPFKKESFDKVLCLGVIQHTPDVEKSFFSLVEYLKPGGSLAIDVYRLKWWTFPFVTQRWVRPITKRIRPATLYRLCERYVKFMWPLARVISKLPYGRYLNRQLLISQYMGIYPLSDEMHKEWSILDTFDGLSPRYDKPQSINKVRQWFDAAGLENVEVHYGYNGIEGRGSRPNRS